MANSPGAGSEECSGLGSSPADSGSAKAQRTAETLHQRLVLFTEPFGAGTDTEACLRGPEIAHWQRRLQELDGTSEEMPSSHWFDRTQIETPVSTRNCEAGTFLRLQVDRCGEGDAEFGVASPAPAEVPRLLAASFRPNAFQNEVDTEWRRLGLGDQGNLPSGAAFDRRAEELIGRWPMSPGLVEKITLGRTTKRGTQRHLCRVDLLTFIREACLSAAPFAASTGREKDASPFTPLSRRVARTEDRKLTTELVTAVASVLASILGDVHLGSGGATVPAWDDPGRGPPESYFPERRTYQCTPERVVECLSPYTEVVKLVGKKTDRATAASSPEEVGLSYQISLTLAKDPGRQGDAIRRKIIHRFWTSKLGASGTTTGRHCEGLVRALHRFSANCCAASERKSNTRARIAFLHYGELETAWNRPILSALEARSPAAEIIGLDARSVEYTLSETGGGKKFDFDLVINRVSDAQRPELHKAAHGFLHLSEAVHRIPVVNGARALGIASSKAVQTGIIEGIGLRSPPTAMLREQQIAWQDVVASMRTGAGTSSAGNIPIETEAPAGESGKCVSTEPIILAAFKRQVLQKVEEVGGFPVLLKPNCGGFGRGIIRIDSAEDLQGARFAALIADECENSEVELHSGALLHENLQSQYSRFFGHVAGNDGTLLVQKFLGTPGTFVRLWHVARGQRIVGAVTVQKGEESPDNSRSPTSLVSLQDADGVGPQARSSASTENDFNTCVCRRATLNLQPYVVSAAVAREVRALAEACFMDVGSIEFFENEGDRFYFDINFLSTLPRKRDLGDTVHADPSIAFANYVYDEATRTRPTLTA